jgi:hypothetical protein
MIVCVFVLKYWKNILYIIEDYKKKIRKSEGVNKRKRDYAMAKRTCIEL